MSGSNPSTSPNYTKSKKHYTINLWSSYGSNKDGGNDYDKGAERLKHNNNKPERAKKESMERNLLRGSYSVLHPWSMCCLLPPASLFLPYFQRTYPPCQQHASQINRKYTHTYKHTGISASILAPSWREYNTLLLIQSFHQRLFSNQIKRRGLAGRPRPLSVELDGWNRHYENVLSACLVALIQCWAVTVIRSLG